MSSAQRVPELVKTSFTDRSPRGLLKMPETIDESKEEAVPNSSNILYETSSSENSIDLPSASKGSVTARN